MAKELFPTPSAEIWTVKPGKPEKWDLYRDDGTLYGTIYQGHLVPDGYYHKSIELIVTDGGGHLLLTRRPDWKGRGGWKWEFPAGSVLSGETTYAAAKRKLLQETSLTASDYRLVAELASDRPGLRRSVYVVHIPDLTERTITLNPEDAVDCCVCTVKSWLNRACNSSFFRLRLIGWDKDLFRTVMKLAGIPEEEIDGNMVLVQKYLSVEADYLQRMAAKAAGDPQHPDAEKRRRGKNAGMSTLQVSRQEKGRNHLRGKHRNRKRRRARQK